MPSVNFIEIESDPKFERRLTITVFAAWVFRDNNGGYRHTAATDITPGTVRSRPPCWMTNV
jgi:hypothetical protein